MEGRERWSWGETSGIETHVYERLGATRVRGTGTPRYVTLVSNFDGYMFELL